LAQHGLARVLPARELSPAALAEAVRIALGQAPALQLDVRLDGAETTVGIVETLVRERRATAGSRNASPAQVKRYDWSTVDNLLSRAADSGRTLTFWWRDDDATAHTPALDRLLALARHFATPIALAAIPSRLDASLTQRVAAEPDVHILVHGLSHTNHAPPGEKKSEFGPHRSPETLLAEAHEALRRTKETAGARFLPVFVPPWNRVAPALAADLPCLGYCGLSRFGPRDTRGGVAGLIQVNTHLDPIDWEGSRDLVSPDVLIGRVARAMGARLDGTAGAEEPIGLLSHHLVHKESTWHFCHMLLEYLSKWGAVRFSSAQLLFG